MIPMKDIKEENNKNNKHMSHRRIAVPNSKTNKHVKRPYKNEFENGNFRNDIYYSYDPAFIAWTYIKFILLYCAPAIIIHGGFLMLNIISEIILEKTMPVPSGAIQIIIIAYGICLFFAFRKISDHMTYFNNEMIVSKYGINRAMLRMTKNIIDIENDKEFAVMNHYRQKYNKYILFPTVKELASTEQLYQKSRKYKNEEDRNYAELRRSRVNMKNKRAEHVAAKAVADWKQNIYGGVNEYDELVKKYKNRTVPAIKEIIKQVQN